jgi:hypothetical protein
MRMQIQLEPSIIVPVLFLGFTLLWAGSNEAHTRLSDSTIQTMVLHRLEHARLL